MITRIFSYIVVILCLGISHKFVLADDPWVLEADSIIDRKANPVLANGHIGFTVFDSSVYMNGLYNGKGPQTHRARIENHANLQMQMCNVKDRVSKKNCRYRFNLRTGVFEVVYSSQDFNAKHELFPHRYYTRTIVNRFTVERKLSKGNITIPIILDPGQIGLDISFPEQKKFIVGKYNITLENGHTMEVENEEFQKQPHKLSMAFTNLNELYVPIGQYKFETIAFMVVDPDEEVLRKEIDRVAFDTELIGKHEKEWKTFWDNFDIEIDSRIELATKIRSSIYYLVSNLPSVNSFQSIRPFYGISSSGLGDVSDDNQLQGRITWDQEMHMLPVLLLINPEWSEEILNYRYNVHATDPLSNGWAYFWETAYTGQHLDVYRELLKSTHVAADVAFATRLHLSATHDKQWFRRIGCELAYNTAKYWAKRTEYNTTSDLYDLKGVRSSSNIDDPITNNAFVNIAAGYNLYLGEFAECMCKDLFKGDKNKDGSWYEIARSLTLPYDDKEEFVLEHSGYEEYIRTTAADMALINFPLQYPLKEQAKRNTLNHYKKLQIRNSPPTTWGMHVIGDLELNNQLDENSLFLDITYYYMERPFNIWTDRVATANRIYNFVSGGAAYLQVFMNGYAGIKIHFDRMEIKHPKVPPHSTRLKIKGFKYLSAKFDLTVYKDKFILTMKKQPTRDDIQLIATSEDGIMYNLIKVGDTIQISSNSTLVITEKMYPYGECKMPSNIIGVPRSEMSLLPLKLRARANAPRVIIGCIIFAFIAILCAFLFILYKRHGTVFPSSAIRYVRNV